MGGVTRRCFPRQLWLVVAVVFSPEVALAAPATAPSADPLSMVLLLAGLSLLPFVLVLTTSFIKFVVTLSILRNAIGTPQVPPTIVITALAVLLSAYVMAPTASKMYELARDVAPASSRAEGLFSLRSAQELLALVERVKEPLRAFLLRNTQKADGRLFQQLAVRSWAQQAHGPPTRPGAGDFIVVVPAFVLGQLAAAFKIGFLVFVPFLVIDLVVANVLLALGMHMLSPTTIALPFKLLLFVLIDGWQLIVRGLVGSFS